MNKNVKYNLKFSFLLISFASKLKLKQFKKDSDCLQFVVFYENFTTKPKLRNEKT